MVYDFNASFLKNAEKQRQLLERVLRGAETEADVIELKKYSQILPDGFFDRLATSKLTDEDSLFIRGMLQDEDARIHNGRILKERDQRTRKRF